MTSKPKSQPKAFFSKNAVVALKVPDRMNDAEVIRSTVNATSSGQDLPRLLTTREATKYLWNQDSHTARSRLYNARTAGRINSVKLCGRHWWQLSALKKLAGVDDG